MTPEDLTIRAAAPADAAALLEIYAPYVEKTAVTFAYAVPSAEEFAGRIARTLERYPYLIAMAEGRIMGYACAGPFKERAAYDWAAETTVYVRRDGRRRGTGRALYAALERSPEASDAAAHAIMTTDTVTKELAVEAQVGGKTVRLGGIAKGSGMIHPNMGTMLCFLTTDCAISSQMIKTALLETVNVSFNRISVDGDTSTNDTCCILANGLAGNGEIREKGDDYAAFVRALEDICVRMARKMAKDGEGAKHLVTCTVSGAKSEAQAEAVSKSVISSTLTKAAIFGCDANWGRVLCAMGYSGENFNPEKVDVRFRSSAGEILVCEQGRGLAFDEGLAKTILTEDEVEILIQMGEGDGSCTCWGCDITYDYIKINGDYRT